MVVRFRSNLESLAGHPELPYRLRVVWEFAIANESGMPDSYTLSQMSDCDDKLIEALETGNHAILKYASTCDGIRQWVFYSSDIEDSARRINRTLPSDPPYPIQIEASSDPEWSEYREVRANFNL
jgi:hypothetical protein